MQKTKYLPDDKKDAKPAGKAEELVSKKFDILIEKCSIPCVLRPLIHNESHIASINDVESLQ